MHFGSRWIKALAALTMVLAACACNEIGHDIPRTPLAVVYLGVDERAYCGSPLVSLSRLEKGGKYVSMSLPVNTDPLRGGPASVSFMRFELPEGEYVIESISCWRSYIVATGPGQVGLAKFVIRPGTEVNIGVLTSAPSVLANPLSAVPQPMTAVRLMTPEEKLSLASKFPGANGNQVVEHLATSDTRRP